MAEINQVLKRFEKKLANNDVTCSQAISTADQLDAYISNVAPYSDEEEIREAEKQLERIRLEIKARFF